MSRRRVVALAGAATVGGGLAGGTVWSRWLDRPSGAEPVGLARLRRFFAERGPIPYERLSVHDSSGAADQVIASGWTQGTRPAVNLDLPIDWSRLGMANRSRNYELHAWEFLAPLLHAYETTGNRRYLDWSADRAVSWARTFNDGGAMGTMAWYDMAIGLRAYRLAFLLEHLVKTDADPDAISVLMASVVRHQRELRTDRAFQPRTNHGFYVAAGQLAFARRLRDLPGMGRLAAQGRDRMTTMARAQFGPDGGHLEHSAFYHLMVLQSFRGAMDAGLLDDAEVRRRVTLADDVLGWFIQPDGRLVQSGDTAADPLVEGEVRTPASPTTRFLTSGGRRGTPNRERLKVLPHAGYAIVRSPQPKGVGDHDACGYLFLHAAFHSRAHKHADDLSITWFDRRREILIDAGRYGYVHTYLPPGHPLRQRGFYYSAPERQYVESTRAHNTVAADGADHARVGREPYGSAIVGAREVAGHFRLQAVVSHGDWRHRRDIVFRPGRWLQVTDSLTALDDGAHDFRTWWNFPEDLPPRQVGTGRLAIDLPGSADTLWVTELGGSRAIIPVSAQRKPLRGWRSKTDLRFTPAWSTGFEALDVRRHTFRTLFHFGRSARDRPFPHPFG